MAVGGIPRQQFVGLVLGVFHRKSTGHAEGVQAMQVATGGQDLGHAQQIATRGRLDIAAIQSPHQALQLVLLTQHAVGVHQLMDLLCLCFGETTQRFGWQVIFVHQLLQQLRRFDVHGFGHGLQGGQAGVAGRHPANHMQAVRNQGVFKLQQLGLQAIDPSGVVIQLGGDLQVHGQCLFVQHLHQRLTLGCVCLGFTAPAFQRLFEFNQAFVQTGFGDAGGQVADERGGSAAFGQRAFRRVVGSVKVNIGQVMDQSLGPAFARQAGLFARHEFQCAMGAKVQHGISTVIFAQIAVEGTEGVGGGEALFKQQPHRVAFIPKRGLHRQQHVAQLQTKHKQAAAIGQVLAGRSPPLSLNFTEPLLVLNVVRQGNLVNDIRLGAVLRGIALQQGLSQGISAFGQFDLIAL